MNAEHSGWYPAAKPRRAVLAAAAGERGHFATPLTTRQRQINYARQRGALSIWRLTPKQLKRILKKANHMHGRMVAYGAA